MIVTGNAETAKKHLKQFTCLMRLMNRCLSELQDNMKRDINEIKRI